MNTVATLGPENSHAWQVDGSDLKGSPIGAGASRRDTYVHGVLTLEILGADLSWVTPPTLLCPPGVPEGTPGKWIPGR